MRRIISPTYAAQNRLLHESSEEYGASEARDLKAAIESLLSVAQHYQAKTLLDFGCGKGVRADGLRKAGLTVFEFDPAIPGKDALPASVDMVIAMDVMEHIEPEYLDNVLETIRDLKPKAFVAMISILPASKTLPDGRNAHLIVESGPWWETRFRRYFKLAVSQTVVAKGRAVAHGIVAEPQ